MTPPLDSSGHGNAPASPPPAAIRAQLERILDSATLQASPRRRAFLRYLVEETLAGRADGLKGYSLELAVFGHDGTFQSQSESVVRFEARRLRRDLDSYYVDAGARDPVRISIPKGQYVPHFNWHQAPTEAPSSSTARVGRLSGRLAQRRPRTRLTGPTWRGARPPGRPAPWPACSPSRSSRRRRAVALAPQPIAVGCGASPRSGCCRPALRDAQRRRGRALPCGRRDPGADHRPDAVRGPSGSIRCPRVSGWTRMPTR